MCFTSFKVTKNISILKSQWDVSKWKTTPIGVLFMPFLGAKPKHYKPYLKLYEEFYQKKLQPVDILVVQADVLDFLSISKGKLLSSNVSDVISNHLSTSSKIIAHGMSVGNFVHAVNLQHIRSNRYKDRIVGQIYDSPVYGGPIKNGGLERIVEGIVETTLSKSKIKSGILRQFLTKAACLGVTPNAKIFDDYISSFVNESSHSPILTFYSSNDVMLDSEKYGLIVEGWKARGSEVKAFCFDDSVHAKHIVHHPQLYKETFIRFLTSLSL